MLRTNLRERRGHSLFERLEDRRLLTAGDLDPSFGAGGFASASFGTESVASIDVAAFGNRTYAAGATRGRIVLAAFDNAGRPDPALGGDGTVVTDVPGTGGGEMLIQPDGKLVVLTGVPQSELVTVARFNPNGTTDRTFGGGDGHTELDSGNDIARAPDGKLMIGGRGPGFAYRFTAARLTADGALDPTFDGDGKLMLEFLGHNDSGEYGAVDVAVQGDGKVLLVGAMVDPDPTDNNDGWFGVVVRLNQNGSYDTTFGEGGKMIWSGRMDNGITAVTVGPRGEVVVAQMEGETRARPVVLNGSGVLSGVQYDAIDFDLPKIHRMHIADDGSIVFYGEMNNWPRGDDGRQTLLGRYTPGGFLDPTFAGGKLIRPFGGQTALAPSGDVLEVIGGSELSVVRYRGHDAATTTSVHQAEHRPQQIVGATASRTYPGYTGDGYVDFRNATGDYVLFETYAHQDGNHLLNIRYANGSRTARRLTVDVGNSGTFYDVVFPSTGSWRNWREISIPVLLIGDPQFAVLHEVRLSTDGHHGPNIDRVTLQRPPAEPVPGFYEAEDAEMVGARPASLNGGFSGTGYADFANAAGDTLTWTVHATHNPQQYLMVRYANGAASDRPLELTVNGRVVRPALSFPSTGSWFTWRFTTLPVPLDFGLNTIRLRSIGSNGPNIDWIRVVDTF